MKTKLTIALAVGCALALPAFSFAKEHEEKELKSSDVPAAVQKAGEKEAAGGKIVRWEKEGKNYEVIVHYLIFQVTMPCNIYTHTHSHTYIGY